MAGNRDCSIAGCEFGIYAKGFCRKHYLRDLKYGDALFEPPRGRPREGDLRTDLMGPLEDWVYIQSTMVFINKKTRQEYTLPAMRAAFGYDAGKLPSSGAIDSFYSTCFVPPVVRGQPSPIPEGTFNTWYIPKSMEWDREYNKIAPDLLPELRHLLDTLGGEHVEYLEKWLAYGIQRPGELSCALILHGVTGSGKSTLAALLREIYGALATTVNMNAIQGEFNPWLDRKLLIIGEEITAAGFRDRERVANMMKTWTVGGDVLINRKNVPQYNIQNLSRWLIFSNDNYPIPVDADDRRYSVIRQSKKLGPVGSDIFNQRQMYAENLKGYLVHHVRLGEDFVAMWPLENDDRKHVQSSPAKVVNLR